MSGTVLFIGTPCHLNFASSVLGLLILKTEAVYSLETFAYFYQTTMNFIPENRTFCMFLTEASRPSPRKLSPEVARHRQALKGYNE
jgi:hypothetical protein